MQWETVIGLEIHAQLATKSKIFSGASTAYGAMPNTQACAVDLGLPGVLPVLNAEVVRMATKFGLAIGAEVSRRSVFARKNYFYPDLPKGYQISQFELPIVGKGTLEIQVDEETTKIVGVTRAHLEEDAGKSLHEDYPRHHRYRPKSRGHTIARNCVRARYAKRKRSSGLYQKNSWPGTVHRHL